MRGELVALDLETTGLDPQHDDIIEIGAVRFAGDRIVDEIAVLVKPTRPIPALVTQLTGIQPDDVQDAPTIATVIPRLRAFVGDAPWVAHNASFDGAFLARQGVLQSNLRIDTFDLAPILLPRAPRYNLTSLTQYTGFNIESAHRALYDARATAHIYHVLWQKLLTLPLALVQEIVELSRDLAWESRPVFEAALRERGGEGAPRNAPSQFLPTDLFDRETNQHPPLQPLEPQQRIDRSAAADILDADGALAQALSGYEQRSGQIEMTQAVADAFNESFHLMIEAGTGIGKSLAYLTPALLWAVGNNDRVVISTNTINLQEQLLNKDIPLLRQTLNLDFSAAIMKGRANYLCPRRLMAARQGRAASVEEARMVAKLLVWLSESRTGDRSEITLRAQDELQLWSRFSAEDSSCGGQACEMEMQGVCPFHKARQAAQSAHLLIVNHALLFSDTASESQVLPDYSRVVLDEGHHIEDAITNSLSVKLDEIGLRRRLSEIGSADRGLLRSAASAVRAGAPERDAERFASFVSEVGTAVRLMQTHVTSLFNALRGVIHEALEGKQDYMARITPPVRALHAFSQVQTAWATLRDFMDTISGALHQAAAGLRRMSAYSIRGLDDLMRQIETQARYLTDTQTWLETLINAPDANTIYWATLGQQENDYLSLNSAPLHIGSHMDKLLWSKKDSVIVTSATLQINGSFEFIQDRLHAQGTAVLDFASPFNYRDSTLLFIPTDVPDPNDRDRYQNAVERGLIELAAALDGRTMVLFTSYAHLRQTAQAITPRLGLGGIAVYDQSDGSSRQTLLDGFKSSEKAILLGTKSFWEGVDIPGSALSAIVIPRLPFSVPSEPVFAARAETYSDPFNEYTVPDAVLRFRQGFGRLIRTRSDRGVVVILDTRIRTKRYGATFLEALPDCTLQHGTLASLPAAAVSWINRTAN
jgi:DNA polymerase-3 subunit epsilon/ATP-dependent DNA helicase DinG